MSLAIVGPQIARLPTHTQWRGIHLEAVWDQLRPQINPFLQVLCVSGSLYRLMDGGAKRFVALKFMEHVQERVMFCRDGTGEDRYFLGAPRHFVAGGGMIHLPYGLEPFWTRRPDVKIETAVVVHPPVPPKPAKIPRPPNAYILYRKERHNLVKESNPGITNNEISQILGRAWNAESREVRQKYKEMSEQVKQALLEKHPDYQYKPRKSSEKRRRTRRNHRNSVAPAESDAAVTSPESIMADAS